MSWKGSPAALAVLFLAGCASTSAPYREIGVVTGSRLPANCAVVGQVEGYDTSDLKAQARARGGDAITTPVSVGLRGQLQSDVLKYR